MFSQLFFVLLALTLITFSPETDSTFWITSPPHAFQWGLGIYLFFLFLLYLQSKYGLPALKGHLQASWWPLINLELLLFLGLYHFGLGAQRFFQQASLASYQTPFIFISLLLYFLAYGWAHLWYAYFLNAYSFRQALRTAGQQLLFLCPFCLPFIVISFLLDGVEHILNGSSAPESMSHEGILLAFSLGLLGLMLIFLPALLILCWRCRSIESSALKERLEERCASLHFRHAGLKTWSLLSHSFTAAIIGVVPAFRYILFTPTLLKNFSPEEIEAILVHEIGHNRYKHLLFYPFILLGMLVSSALVLLILEKSFYSVLEPFLQTFSYFTLSTALFILYALLLGLYFRLVFGFFSRLFERQADLYIFESSLPPIYLIQAFDRLGVITGYTHTQPSWHHFSLQERIHFLEQALEDPFAISRHHRRVKLALILYFFMLFLGCITLYKMM